VRRTERVVQIRTIFAQSRGVYGSPKITAVLRQQGECITQKTVARLMRAAGLHSRVVKKYHATTNSRHAHPVADNILNRPCVAERPHPVWMTDITYIATDEGWLYWASVEDLYSRQIVGWAMGDRITQDLVLQAFDQAVARYRPPEGVLHHSDRGSQYAAEAYRDRLAAEALISHARESTR
jgi:putative transposase